MEGSLIVNLSDKNGVSSKAKKVRMALVIFTIMVICWLSFRYFNNSYFIKHPQQATFAKLEKIRKEKKEQVVNYLDQQSRKGNQISKNKDIMHCFKELLLLHQANAYLGPEYNKIERKLEELFVMDLDEFYDMLFINKKGDVFFTIKKEDDFLSNIHDSRFDDIYLYKIIRDRTAKIRTDDVTFVDYDYYPMSAEPASFFVAPVIEKGQTIGYVVLQLAINHINDILTDRSSMGRTGEVYLVSDKQLMLTQSRFIDSVTSLNKVVDTKAVKDSLTKRKDNKIIDDYRGKRVFSSYERFDYKGTEWIIIAEIDVDEVITDLYMASEDKFFEKSIEYLEQYPFPEKQHAAPAYPTDNKNMIKVDVKEIMKSKNHEILYTRGVASCTALTISYPGKFAYMAHISPTDEVYESIDWMTKLFLKNKQTNFVGNLMANINMVDISQHEKSYLKFAVITTGDNSIKNIIHKLVSNGISLSQIKILYRKQYDSVNIIFDYDKDRVWSQWKGKGAETSYGEHYRQIPDLGEIVKTVSNYKTVSTNIDS